MDHAALAGACARPHRIVWKNRPYDLSVVTGRVKADVVSACREGATREVAALKGILDPADYREVLMDHSQAVRRGDFAFDGALVSAWRETPEGQVATFRALLGDSGSKLSDDELIEFVADSAGEIEAWAATVSLLIDGDPENPKAPAAA